MRNVDKAGRDHGLAAASLAAVKWDYGGSAIRALSSLLVTIVLARLLGPEAFGLVTAAWLMIGLANLVADLGMGPALLQRGTISKEDVRYAFTVQICIGLCLFGLLVLFAPWISRMFKEEKIAAVIRAMSLVFVFQTVGAVASILLKRDMDFRSIQFAQISSYLAGFVALGIPLALLGFEVWSLISAQLAQTLLFSVLSYNRVRHPIKPLFSSPSRGFNLFGLKVLSTNLLNYSIATLESFFIGRFFGVSVLGLYNRAYVLVSTPMNNVVGTLQQVGFSAYSRKQNDIQTTRRAYLAGVGFIAMLMVPTYGCVALIPATVIEGLFGTEWKAAIPLLTPLALAMPFHALMVTGGPMLWANDRVGREFVAQLTTAFVLVIVLLVTSKVSAIAVAWGVLGVTILRFVLITHASLKTVQASWTVLAFPGIGSIVLLILSGTLVSICDRALVMLETAAFGRLVIDLLVGCTVFVGTAFFVPKLIISHEMCWLAERFVDVLPTWMRPLVKRHFCLAAPFSSSLAPSAPGVRGASFTKPKDEGLM